MFYAYDTEGCAYAQNIRFYKEKKNLRGFIDEAADWDTIKRLAGRYIYDMEKQIEYSYDREYWERVGYPEFDPDEWEEFWGDEEDYFPECIEDWDNDNDDDYDYYDDSYYYDENGRRQPVNDEEDW